MITPFTPSLPNRFAYRSYPLQVVSPRFAVQPKDRSDELREACVYGVSLVQRVNSDLRGQAWTLTQKTTPAGGHESRTYTTRNGYQLDVHLSVWPDHDKVGFTLSRNGQKQFFIADGLRKSKSPGSPLVWGPGKNLHCSVSGAEYQGRGWASTSDSPKLFYQYDPQKNETEVSIPTSYGDGYPLRRKGNALQQGSSILTPPPPEHSQDKYFLNDVATLDRLKDLHTEVEAFLAQISPVLEITEVTQAGA